MYGTGLQRSLALADLPLRKLWKRRSRHTTKATSKVSLEDFDQDVVWRTIVSMYSLKKVLSTLDNIRTELLRWQQGSSSQRSPSYEVCLHTLWGESKSADGKTRCSSQQDQIPSHGQRVERGGYETYVHTSHAFPKCWQDSTSGLKMTFF